MLNNFWYACEFSSAITNKPKQILMLNQRFVLYRNSQGQVVALKDQCPHRGAAFSLGWVEGDCILCPFHGWKFQADGTCVRIPANQLGVPIPKKARVDSYPVQEKYGFIWIFYGDLPEEERPPIPHLPDSEDTTLRKIMLEYRFNAHYTRMMENDIDFSHVSITHVGSIGNGFEPEQKIEDYNVNLEDWGGQVTVNIKNYTKTKDIFKYILHQFSSKMKITLSFYMPNITLLEVDFGRGKLINLHANVPVDNNTTITKRIQFRSFLTFPWADAAFRRLTSKVAMEDKEVVESEYPKVIPDKLSDEVHIPCDASSVAYRKLRQKCQAMGWDLKPNTSKADSSNGHLSQPSSTLLVN